jgi:hypothetical protein
MPSNVSLGFILRESCIKETCMLLTKLAHCSACYAYATTHTLNFIEQVLDIKPRPTASRAVPGVYGFSPNVSSWGGNIVLDDEGTYHLYVSEMVGDCGLKTWGACTPTAVAQ